MHPLREHDKDVQRFLLRIGSSLKTDLQALSVIESRSLNYLINEAIAEYVERYLENHSD
jgi:predicted transcriptional regulator